MYKLRYLSLIALLLALLAMVFASAQVSSQSEAHITLSPSSGFSSFTIEGTGFADDYLVIIEWDGQRIDPFPRGDIGGDFITIVDVPAGAEPGPHTVTARDIYDPPNEASAIFTVIDMTGAQGIRGPQGPAGEDGAPGLSGSVGTIGPVGPAGNMGNQGPPGKDASYGISYAALFISFIAIGLNLFQLARGSPD